MTILRYEPQWGSRARARTFHDYFHLNTVHKYHSVQVTIVQVFLRHLLKSPDRFISYQTVSMHHVAISQMSFSLRSSAHSLRPYLS